MNARIIKAWNDLQSSYYFIPGLMALGAMILAWMTAHLDMHYDYEIAENMGWFYSNKADGARAILTTIAASMMTVASVTFSITMVAVTSAAGQYGPRLIGNFMRDRANQITLGTFTSTFVYCLLILRSARTGDGGNGENAVAEFVPNISLLVAMGLTLASVAVMIYFIHHIPETLNVGNITGRVGRKLRGDLEKLFPEDSADLVNHRMETNAKPLDVAKSDTVSAHAEGYLQAINADALLKFAQTHDCIIKITAKPGDFITRNASLVQVWINAGGELERDEHAAIRSAFAMGQERTSYQNVLFLSDQLVEILARALSPGVNDPFTAINCIHWFQSGLQTAIRGHPVMGNKVGEDGQIRVISPTLEFDVLINNICDQVRPYVARDSNVSRVMLEMLFTLLQSAKTPSQKSIIQKHIETLEQACHESLKTVVERSFIQNVIVQNSKIF